MLFQYTYVKYILCVVFVVLEISNYILNLNFLFFKFVSGFLYHKLFYNVHLHSPLYLCKVFTQIFIISIYHLTTLHSKCYTYTCTYTCTYQFTFKSSFTCT